MHTHQNPNREAASDEAQVRQDEEGDIDFRHERGRVTPSDVRNILATVAVLLASATYQAVYNPPGGLWQEDYPDTNHHVAGVPTPAATQTSTEVKHVAGVSILATKSMYLFIVFIFVNTLGFMGSINTIDDLTRGFTHKLELNLALYAISFSYGWCSVVIVPSENQTLAGLAFGAVFVVSLIVRIWGQKLARLFTTCRGSGR